LNIFRAYEHEIIRRGRYVVDGVNAHMGAFMDERRVWLLLMGASVDEHNEANPVDAFLKLPVLKK